jgi:hypothetical protein
MGWFQRLCRDAGLMVHHIVKPEKSERREVKRTVEEKRVSSTTTLRRTTIEEIEIRPGDNE